jgi:hypothetical protein
MEYFPITSVCRADIPEAFGFPRIQKKAKELADKLTDEEMKELATFIGEQCCESDVFWHAINDWMCDKFGDELG